MTPRSKGEILLTAEKVSKKFCRDLKRSLWYGVKESVADLMGRREGFCGDRADAVPLRDGEFWAVQDIDFELRRGQCLGLLGRNGAGKTTLLKMINGLIKPDAGRITIRGNVSGLIALGAGFNPILTGRENISVNGSILGLSRRQIADRLEQIIDFSEIGNAIDAPVRTYSSGMQVRLGFSSAVNLIAPDVLLLDEVLAVGDLGFVIKCLNRMRDLASQSAVIFVSHSMQFVTMFCTHGMLMKDGQVKMLSNDLGDVVEGYNKEFEIGTHVSGTGEAEILQQDLFVKGDHADRGETRHISIQHGENLWLRLRIRTSTPSTAEVYIHTINLIPVVASTLTDEAGRVIEIPTGTSEFEINLGRIELNAGRYPLMVVVNGKASRKALVRIEGASSITVKKQNVDWGMISKQFLTTPVKALN
jgi:lipopolysaccharide transport system ATP-binding protein